ncbi:MAG TPA: alpha-ribazole phosphatase family protein [Rudaea sp.]|nr:alpha-ribazole phosphatase family protein [Rudaea sp.]
MDLILVRHGEVDAPAGLCLGQTDAPLSAAGFGAVQQLAATWSGPAPRFVFCSDLKRAQQSAAIFAAQFALEPLADGRLREVNLGDWDGKRWDEVVRSDAARYEHWTNNWVIQEAPNGESFADVIRRTGAWLSSLLGSTGDDDCVLAVAHAGSMRALLCHALGLPPAQAFTMRIDLAHCARMRTRSGQFEVCYVNASRFEAD